MTTVDISPASVEQSEERAPRRRRAGWRAVARKELADHLHSIRFLLLVLLLSLSAIAAMVAATGRIRGVAEDLTGGTSVFLRLFTLQLAETPLSFVSLVAIIGPLLGIAFGFDAISSERADRTLPRLLSQPIHRDDVVNGKFVAGLAAIALVLTALTAVVAGISILRLGIIPTTADAARLLAWLVVSIVYVGVWLALAILLSVRLRRAATSAMASIAVWLVLTLFGGLLVGMIANVVAPAGAGASIDDVIRNVQVERALGRASPGFLYEEATGPLLAPERRTLAAAIAPLQAYRAIPGELGTTQSLLLVWPQIVGLVALKVVLFAAAYISFLREEVRA
jgi:ABC-2 type transport system permease protein